MPFLRFTRDKRGYETTSLVHAIRQRGRARQRILYWFRTPPGVRVGRPALDEDAIRSIEEHNPDIEFDWPKILQAQPSPAPPPDDGRNRRGRRDPRDKGERPGREGRRRPGQQQQPSRSAEPPRQPAADAPAAAVEPEIAAQVDEPAGAAGVRVADVHVIDALEQMTHPDGEELLPPSLNPVESAVGKEQLTRIRARYAELQARITERGGDAARIGELRGQAEALNPDTWVTDEEARKGLEEFEPKIRDLRAALGLRRRRRSRRGGRRRHRGGKDSQPIDAGSEPTITLPDTSNPADSAADSEPLDNEEE